MGSSAQSGGGDSWSSNGAKMGAMFLAWALGQTTIIGGDFYNDAMANSFRNAQ